MKARFLNLPRICLSHAHTTRLLSLVLLCAGALAAHADLPFLVVSDWGTYNLKVTGQQAVAQQMGRTASQDGSRFVITSGDNFHSDGISSVDDPLWKSHFEDVYSAPSLQTPWYPALGNHDHLGNPQAEIDYSRRSPRWRLYAPYYTWTDAVDGDTVVQFFVLDTTSLITGYQNDQKKPGNTDPATLNYKVQIAWLEKALAASTAQWKIVIGHHPIYSGGEKHGDTEALKALVKPLLVRYGVQAYFAGHEHDFQHLRDEAGINYFVISGGSVQRPTGKHRLTVFNQGATYGFGHITLAKNTMAVRFIDDAGTCFYDTQVPQSRPTAP